MKYNRKKIFSIRKFSVGIASVMIGTSLVSPAIINNKMIRAQEKIEVQVNSDLQTRIIPKEKYAIIEIIAQKNIRNIDAKVSLGGNKVVNYYVENLNAGEKIEKIVTLEQLDLIKKQLDERKKS